MLCGVLLAIRPQKGDPLLLEFCASFGDVGINLVSRLWNIEGRLGVEAKFGLELLRVIRFER